MRKLLQAMLVFIVLLLSSVSYSAEFHVIPTASSSGTGTLANPMQFQTALSSSTSPAHSGDTVWVHGGTYRGSFINDTHGQSGNPIIFRNYQNQRVTVVSYQDWRDAIQVNGSWTWFWGIEVTADPAYTLNAPGGGFNINGDGDGIKLINCVSHDLVGGGAGWWIGATNSEINGCLFYYNGREIGSGNNAHNYGIYMQNTSGRKLFKDNIDIYNWSIGAHVYSEQQGISFITFDGDVLAQAGWIWQNPNGGRFERNILMGAYISGNNDGDTLKNSHFVFFNPSGDYAGARETFGYFGALTHFSMSGTTFVNGIMEFNVSGSAEGNNFYGVAGSVPGGNTVATIPTSGTTTVIRPNDYESGRANIIVYNWGKSSSVNVNLSSFITAGSSFVVHDAENFYGTPVAQGTYQGGNISLPMNSSAVATPVLASGQTLGAQPFNTQPIFGVFIVTSSSGPMPVQLSSFTVLHLSASQAKLSWTTQSEVNDYGFQIERLTVASWDSLGFVAGSGTSSVPHDYSFTDNTSNALVSYRLKQINLDNTFSYYYPTTVTGIDDNQTALVYRLSQNYPNPFNPTTEIQYTLKKDGLTTLAVYNILGQRMMTLVDQLQSTGTYHVKLDGSRLASGTYIYVLMSGDFKAVKKLQLMK